MSVAPRAKEALEHAWQDASERGRLAISPAGLLLGMVDVEDALSNRLLRDLGVTPEDIGAALRAAS